MNGFLTSMMPLLVMAIPIVGATIWTISRLKTLVENLCKEVATLCKTIGRLNDRMDKMEQRCTAHRAATSTA